MSAVPRGEYLVPSRRLLGFLIIGYVVSLPFVHAFAVSGWLPIPILIMGAIGIVLTATGTGGEPIRYSQWSIPEFLLLTFLGTLFLSRFVNLPIQSSKEITHHIGYVAVIAAYYFLFRTALDNAQLKFDHLTFALCASVILASSVAILEWIALNFQWIPNIQNLIWRRDGMNVLKALSGSGFYRARSLAREPGHFALFLESITPIATGFAIHRGKQALAVVTASLGILALASTFSAAAIVAIGAGFLVLFVFEVIAAGTARSRRHSYRTLAATLLIGLAGVLAFALIPSFHPLIDKVTLSRRFERLDDWVRGVEIFLAHPAVGVGPGSFLKSELAGGGVISWWLRILVEGGVLSGGVLLAFWATVARISLRLPSPLDRTMLFSWVVAGAHYGVVSNFWYPWPWFIAVMAGYLARRHPLDRATEESDGNTGDPVPA